MSAYIVGVRLTDIGRTLYGARRGIASPAGFFFFDLRLFAGPLG
jgi:hypothetical protein